MHITISGNLGSGKSTVCNCLRRLFGFKIYSTGDIHRSIARDMNITTLQLNQFMQEDFQYDQKIDNEVKRLSDCHSQEDIIFDSRIAWHFVKKSCKVFLLVNPDLAAERIFAAKRGSEEKYSSIEDARIHLKARAQSERERFKLIYGLDYISPQNYDLIIDSTGIPADIIAKAIYFEARNYYTEEFYEQKILLSPKNLYPTRQEEDWANEHFVDAHIDVIRHQNYFFIWDGHLWAMTGVRNNAKYVSVNIVAENSDDTIELGMTVEKYLRNVNISIVHDYERICGFKFVSYPKFLSGG